LQLLRRLAIYQLDDEEEAAGELSTRRRLAAHDVALFFRPSRNHWRDLFNDGSPAAPSPRALAAASSTSLFAMQMIALACSLVVVVVASAPRPPIDSFVSVTGAPTMALAAAAAPLSMLCFVMVD
jgi:hypothetical protein